MNKFMNFNKKMDAGLIFSVVILTIVGYLIFSSVYSVKENQVGVLKTFGKASRINGAGVHIKLPYPLEQVTILETGKVRTLEIGTNSPATGTNSATSTTSTSSTTSSDSSNFPKEAAMLTKDDSLIWINLLVDWKISDPVKFINVVEDPEEFLHSSTLQLVRHEVGALTFNDILVSNRTDLEDSIRRQLITIMNAYGLGISIEDVRFLGAVPPSSISEEFSKIDQAVQRKASDIENAKSYAANQISIAKNNAESLLRSNSTYREEKIEQAKAETAKFENLYAEYKVNKSVTRSRLYFEMLKEILPKVERIIISGDTDKNTTYVIGGNADGK